MDLHVSSDILDVRYMSYEVVCPGAANKHPDFEFRRFCGS
jgi:hypothetical protein